MPEFLEPQWDAPLDVEAELRAMPEGSVIKGMFPHAVLAEALRRDITLHPKRDRYLPFLDYPVGEHVELIVEAARALHPDVSLRRGLRRLGRRALAAFTGSVIGRVVMHSEDDIRESLDHTAKAYEIAHRRAVLDIQSVDVANRSAHLRFRDLYFIDSHQVGVIEGVLATTVGKANVRVFAESLVSGELWCTWQ